MKRTDLRTLLQSFAGNPAECWNWPRHISITGYGACGGFLDGMRYRGSSHRAAYMAWKGRIPDGFTIDHLCRNRACFNPAHLEAVTNRVNILRGTGPAAQNAAKTHCSRGHPLVGDNLRVDANGRSQSRRCLACHQARGLAARGPARGTHNRNKTHCIRGHEFTPENTRYYPQTHSPGVMRKCWQCHTEKRQKA